MPKKPSSKRAGASASAGKISDPRFANFETDPRFRLPSKRQAKTKLDKRFSRMLTDEDFTATSKVDRYGRKIKSDSKKKALQRLYEAEEEDKEEDEDEDDEEEEESADEASENDDDDDVRKELRAVDKKLDPARGGGFDTSDDSDSDDDSDAEADEEADLGGASMQRFQEEQASVPTGEVSNRIAIVNMDWDNIKSADLFVIFSSFVPTGGKIEKVSIYPSEFGMERMQQEELEGPPKELFKKPAKSSGDHDGSEDDESSDESEDRGDEDDEKIKKELLQEGDDADFDSDALRSYQLDRLRYYYAVMVCSNKATAEKIYQDVDGREYLASSNFLDLRFIPDDVTFDDEPRDECDSVPAGYKPVEFVTDALQHSKVKLTWDMHPGEVTRKDQMQRAFTGSRNDIAENDLRAYLASDSESEEEEEIEEVVEGEAAAAQEDQADGENREEQPTLSKKELARRKMRAALGLTDDDATAPAKRSKAGPVGDMQITFTPALLGKPSKSGGASKDAAGEETTIEKYARKERERKEKKREKARAKREGVVDPDDAVEEAPERPPREEEDQDLGFDDPFFATTAEADASAPTKSASSVRKEERRKKREAREAAEKASAAERAKLELLMAEDTNTQTSSSSATRPGAKHFDMNEIIKEEKRKAKTAKLKGKKARKAAAAEDESSGPGLLQRDFEMDVDDARFKAVFEDHEFAIDPSNPKFKPTSGMKKLLEKGRSRRKDGAGGSGGGGAVDDGDEGPVAEKTKKKGSKRERVPSASGELAGLVESVKKKSRKH